MSDFVEHLHEVFYEFGAITAKRMFGGHGIFHEERMFGLIADDVLYLKADQQSCADFVALDLSPFEYSKAGKVMKMSYYQAPESIYDDSDEATLWAHKAFAAALRSK
ncbi:MAG: TfoX/Sxy family protein [Oceanococcus sp.]